MNGEDDHVGQRTSSVPALVIGKGIEEAHGARSAVAEVKALPSKRSLALHDAVDDDAEPRRVVLSAPEDRALVEKS